MCFLITYYDCSENSDDRALWTPQVSAKPASPLHPETTFTPNLCYVF